MCAIVFAYALVRCQEILLSYLCWLCLMTLLTITWHQWQAQKNPDI